MGTRRFVMGDIHGEADKLKAALKAVNFDYENDELIQLGDIVDRGLQSYECVEELLKIKKLISIKGNHDVCFYDSIRTGRANILFNQGGKQTLQSYIRNCDPDKEISIKLSEYSTDFDYDNYPITHINFFANQKNYYLDQENNFFVHGGFDRHKLVEEESDPEVFYWDRDLFLAAKSYASMKNNNYPFKMKNNFKEVFIGHTPTTYFEETKPINAANIWNLDTGCGKGGLLTIMNVKTKEYVQV